VSDMAEAMVAAAGFSVLISFIEILSKSKAALQQLLGTRFLLYVLILILGNTIATGLASASPPPVSGLSSWYWNAFLGVFGFQAIIQNINVTFASKGFLTINDWINTARDSAVADAVEAEADSKLKKIQVLAKRLAQLPLATLNTHVAAMVNTPNAVIELAQQAQQQGLDEAFLKALTLATTDYKKASQI